MLIVGTRIWRSPVGMELETGSGVVGGDSTPRPYSAVLGFSYIGCSSLANGDWAGD